MTFFRFKFGLNIWLESGLAKADGQHDRPCNRLTKKKLDLIQARFRPTSLLRALQFCSFDTYYEMYLTYNNKCARLGNQGYLEKT